jgi:hypothetical protein
LSCTEVDLAGNIYGQMGGGRVINSFEIQLVLISVTPPRF